MATIHDVAQMAGVSKSAVSAVINGRYDQVGKATRERILDAAKTLGYRPHRIARQLVTGRFDAVALCFTTTGPGDFLAQVPGRLLEGLLHRAQSTNKNVMLVPSGKGGSVEALMKDIPSLGVDGLILVGPLILSAANIADIDSCSVPVVCVDSFRGFKNASTVDTDNGLAISDLVNRMSSRGFKKLTFITPPPGFQCLEERMQAFKQAYTEVTAGGTNANSPDAVLVIDDDSGTIIGLKELLSSPNRPQALICSESRTLYMVLQVCNEVGLTSPEDIVVTSVDNVTSMQLGSHSIVTVNPPFFEVGCATLDVINQLIDGSIKGNVTLRIPPSNNFEEIMRQKL